ncbi:type II toxin-antitoxin system VapC family toxin [Spirosoma daeguense]
MTIFLDSSILIEYSKGNKKELMINLLSRSYRLVYNSIVVMEYVYHALGHYGQKAPRTLKEARRIPEVLTKHNSLTLFNLFEQITDNHPSADEVLRLMTTYNMLPNDAIILAHCLNANISFLASYDSDFQEPCRKEGITLIDSVDALNSHFSPS